MHKIKIAKWLLAASLIPGMALAQDRMYLYGQTFFIDFQNYSNQVIILKPIHATGLDGDKAALTAYLPPSLESGKPTTAEVSSDIGVGNMGKLSAKTGETNNNGSAHVTWQVTNLQGQSLGTVDYYVSFQDDDSYKANPCSFTVNKMKMSAAGWNNSATTQCVNTNLKYGWAHSYYSFQPN